MRFKLHFTNIIADASSELTSFFFNVSRFFLYYLQKPLRRGVVGHTLVMEELGSRKVNDGVRSLNYALYLVHVGNGQVCNPMNKNVYFFFGLSYFQNLYVLSFANRLDEEKKGEVSYTFELIVMHI